MGIDDTIQTLTRIYKSIDRGIPKTATGPDALVNHLNDLYSESAEDLTLKELFVYDDVVRPSITLIVSIDVEFNPKSVMENMRKKLHAEQCSEADEIGRTGTIWSHGHYDFAYDDSGLLRISHEYSHKAKYTRSVLSIMKKMIDYARNYLEEVKKSAEEGTSIPET